MAAVGKTAAGEEAYFGEVGDVLEDENVVAEVKEGDLEFVFAVVEETAGESALGQESVALLGEDLEDFEDFPMI